MNSGSTLAVLAGAAIGARVVVNALAVRFLGVGALFGVSGLATAATGFAVTFSRPGMAGRAILYAVVSGVLGAFILAAVTVASGRAGLARTLSHVVASRLIAGLLIGRTGLFGPAAADFGPVKVPGVALIVAGGSLVVRG